MADKPFRFGPTALTTAAVNMVNPPTFSAGVISGGTAITGQYAKLTHVRIVNKTGAPATFSCFVGATGGSAAGTEVIGSAKSVAANDAYDWYGSMRLDIADFFTALASANTTLTIEGEGVLAVA